MDEPTVAATVPTTAASRVTVPTTCSALGIGGVGSRWGKWGRCPIGGSAAAIPASGRVEAALATVAPDGAQPSSSDVELEAGAGGGGESVRASVIRTGRTWQGGEMGHTNQAHGINYRARKGIASGGYI